MEPRAGQRGKAEGSGTVGVISADVQCSSNCVCTVVEHEFILACYHFKIAECPECEDWHGCLRH